MNEWNHGEFAAFFKKRETGLVYFYTPMCGTCQLAGKMLQVVGMMKPDLVIGKINLNYHPDIARQFTIESVPCLLFVRDGVVVEAIYAFQSVPYLLEKIKLNFG